MATQTLRANNADVNDLVEYGFKRVIITVTVVMCALLELIDTTIVNVATNTLMGNLGATINEVSWVIAAYAIANVIVVPLSSWLSARFGRKNYFGASVIIFTVGSLLCGTSHGIWELVLWRFVQGLGGGALFATSQSILVEIYPKEKIGMANAFFGMGIIVGPTIGPLLGGYLVDNYEWPVLFYVNIPIGIVAAFLTFKYIRNNPHQKQHSKTIDWIGILLLIIGIGSVQLVLEQGEKEDWFESRMIAFFTFAAISGLCLFIWRMLVVKNPIVDIRILSKGSVAIGTILNFILGFGLFGSVFVIPLLLQRYLGFTATMTGLLFTPGALLSGFLMPIIGKMLQKGVPPKAMIAIGFTLFAGFIIWCSFFISADASADNFFWPLILRGVGMSLLFVPLANLTLGGLKGQEIAQGAGISNMVRQIGGSFGVAIISALVVSISAQHREDISAQVSLSNTQTLDRITALTQGYARVTPDPRAAEAMVYKTLSLTIDKQAQILTYINVFQLLGLAVLISIPLVFFVKTKKGEKVDTSGAH